MRNNIQKQLTDWADKYVPIFNDLSTRTHTIYYTQSPLNEVESEIDLMIIGINPKCKHRNAHEDISKTTDDFLKGNPHWENRFSEKWDFIENAHHFLGYDKDYHPESIDNEKKTVWTNISPFQSNNGFTDLPNIVLKDSIDSLMDLISILKPKRIVLLCRQAFDKFEKYASRKQEIEHTIVVDDSNDHNKILQIGRIQGISTVCVDHPSGRGRSSWAISNTFNSLFIFLFFLIDELEDGKTIKTLKEVKIKMIQQLLLCQSRMNIHSQ